MTSETTHSGSAQMAYTTLGRTGLRVSVLGLGGGGHSRLGLSTGGDEANAEAVVRRGLELGINFIDTAESYGTQSAIGRALKDVRRDEIVLSTKKWAGKVGEFLTPRQMAEGVEQSLRELGTDYLDIFHMHGLQMGEYDYVVGEIVPELQAMQQAGKIRFLGVTEMFNADSSHEMLSRAVGEGCWDVIMVGLNMLNPSAGRDVLPAAAEAGVGTLVMFAVRNALSRPKRLAEVVDQLIDEGKVDAASLDRTDPLGFVLVGGGADGGASSVVEAAYRYCRWRQGVDVVLTGTGDVDHLASNVESILRPALPDDILARLDDVFGQVDSVSGS
ncbi:hypothetical protein LCGC14_0303930 [marine sediment metagenome]|uniref:NADP-dependent oxidoreductase domain-containing protein n=1 Tax=marine sediment metagenome TaxID=412755 RepID=A0A0F9WVL4_9ZZZZ